MPATYDWSKTPKSYLDKNDKIGLLIGSLLAGGMGAATGQGGRDSVLRGVAGATAGFGGGANALEDNYSKMIADNLRRQNQEYEQNIQNRSYDQRVREYEETEKPYYQARTQEPTKYKKRMEQLNLAKKKNEVAESRKNLVAGDPSRRDWWTWAGNELNPETKQLEGISFNAAKNEYQRKPIPVSGKEIQPKIKPTLPESATTDLSDFVTLLDLSKTVRDTYDPSYSGAIQGRYGKVKENWIGGLSEDQLKFNQSLESIKNRLIYLRTGKQINEQEFKRMMQELPDVRQPDSTAKVRLDNFYTMSEDLLNNRMKGLGAAGFRNVGNIQEALTQPKGQSKTAEEYLNKFK